MVKTIEIPSNEVSNKLQAINGLLGLSNQELEVLTVMIEGYPEGFGRIEKKEILAKTNVTSPAALNNLLAQLKRKGIIRKNGLKWAYSGLVSNLSIMNSLILKFNAETGNH